VLNSSNRTTPIEKKVEIEVDEKQIPAFPLSSADISKELEINQESQLPIVNTGHQRA
jgi:hypothetical protein